MAEVADMDRPEQSMTTDVTLVTRGITVPTRVEVSTESTVVVRPSAPAHARQLGVKPGEAVELYWRARYEERTLPAEITAIEEAETPYWHLRATGPAQRSQRRKAVRALVDLPVTMACGDAQLVGETVDLSEAGLRAEVDGWGLPPEPGTPV